MTVVITCTSFPLQAFAPAVAYAATPTAAELSEKNADKARAELLTAIGADLPGLYEDDTQQFLADATSQNTAWEGVSSQVTDGTVQVATSDDSNITYTADGQPLYDSVSDTIYIYNALQTAVSRQDDAADQPVLTGDGDAETFGTGQPIHAEGSDEPLTYSPEHTYIYVDGWDEGLEDDTDEEQIALQSVEEESGEKSEEDSDEGQSEEPAGDEEKGDSGEQETDAATASTQSVDDETEGDGQPTTTAEEDASTIEGAEVLSDGEDGTTGKVLLADEKAVGDLDGRDYVGQVTKEINGETYILIGNEQQLRMIGSNEEVYGNNPIYQETIQWVADIPDIPYSTGDWVSLNDQTVLYYGDADVSAGEKLKRDFVEDDIPFGGHHNGDICHRYYTIVNGKHESVEEIKTGLNYSSDANYIVFRDIDLSVDAERGITSESNAQADWEPLMFSGTMLGAVCPPVDEGDSEMGALWQYIDVAAGRVSEDAKRPVISNVTVVQPEGDLNIEDQMGIGFFASLTSKSSIGSSGIVASGKVVVSNIQLSSVSVENRSTTVHVDSGLLDTLIGAVGTLLDFLTLGALDLSDLLNMHKSDPSSHAAGAFVGRVYGDVSITDCTVSNVSVSNVMDMTGGFAGYIEGMTEYGIVDGLIISSLIELLVGILDIIPFLGLGTVVDWLLSSTLGLDNLFPTGYVNPSIANCHVID
ncbi:hypothetical protein, partial [Collinsella ihumii]|uniref:hypothetical protein n=1 Tax=Collinsella ihumii TaxID=1720204 RepID=UPI0025AAFE2E